MRDMPARADSNPGVLVGDGETGTVVAGLEVATVVGTVVGRLVGGVVAGVVTTVCRVVGRTVVVRVVGFVVTAVVGFVTYPWFPIRGFWSWTSTLTFPLV